MIRRRAEAFANSVRRSSRSWLGWFLVILHGVCFVGAIRAKRPPSPEFARWLGGLQGSSSTIFAGRPFHFHYESTLTKVVVISDMPLTIAALPLSVVVALTLWPMHLGLYYSSYVEAGITLLAATLQWLTVGRLIQDRLKPAPRRLAQHRQHPDL